MLNKAAIIRFLLVAAFSILAATVLQEHLGSSTIYSPAHRTERMLLHEAILANSPPKGLTWREIGAGGTNIRILTVYLADGLHRLTNADVNTIYKNIDTASMIVFLTMAFYYFEQMSGTVYALAGVLYMVFSFVTTYSFYYFHPWDRLSLVVWLLLLIAIKKKQFPAVAGLLVIGMLIKFDVILVPALYLAYCFNRNSAVKSVGRTLMLFTVTIGVYWALDKHFHAASAADASQSTYQLLLHGLKKNLRVFSAMWLTYPPLTVFGLSLSFSAYYLIFLREYDRFATVSAIFGIMMFGPYLAVNFHETRALMPILLLLMPSVLLGLRKLTAGSLATTAVSRLPVVQQRSMDAHGTSAGLLAREVSGQHPSGTPWSVRVRDKHR